jgi:hypothetical protein
VPLSGRPAKNKRGVPRVDADGGQRANGTPDDPLDDTPCSRVRVESSLAGFSKEVRIHIARCLFLAIARVHVERRVCTHIRPLVIYVRCLSPHTQQDIGAATPALLLKKDEKLLLFDLDRSTQGTTRQLKLGDMQLSVGKYKKGRRQQAAPAAAGCPDAAAPLTRATGISYRRLLNARDPIVRITPI